MYAEDDLLPLSGLQHFQFCERRWALVHLEQLWEENRFTAEGRVLHERAHSGEIESRPGVLVRRTLPVRSYRLGVSGQSDIVEFTPADAGPGVVIEGKKGSWQAFPIEYKRSKDRGISGAYHLQLCAQAMCLEEMLGIPVPQGAVLNGQSKRRDVVVFTPNLRRDVERAALRMHELFEQRTTPAPIYMRRCEKCSLREVCQPKTLMRAPLVSQYFARALADHSENGSQSPDEASS